MARTGIDQIAVLTDTTCGNPRADEAVKWGLVQDSLKSVSHRGQTLVSAWGPKVDGNVRPILGGARQTRSIDDPSGRAYTFFPFGVHTYEVMFEQPSFITSGAVSVADHFVLSTKFCIGNAMLVIGQQSGDSYAYRAYGKVKITLSNSGGTQVLLHHTSSEYLALISGSGITTTSGITTLDSQEVEMIITGALGNTLIPPIGNTHDSKLIFEIDGFLVDDGSSPHTPIADIGNGLVSNAASYPPPYLGIAGATFRIFNPAA